ncbi:MAG: hypothetical protein IJQ56_00595, partial [Synergistaceae bacterium]|nr:hypothetical protein [Synergistaceae bacterium]
PVKVLSLKHSVHKPEYYDGFYNLDENGEIIEHSTTREIHFDKIRINHYFTKSKEEYIQKMTRGKADKNDIRSMEEFYLRDRNECEDTEILSHV